MKSDLDIIEELVYEFSEDLLKGNYQVLYDELALHQRPLLTSLLLECNVDILQNMKAVPRCFATELCIESIQIGKDVEEIDAQAFRGCQWLTSVTAEEGCKFAIEPSAFKDCGSLVSFPWKCVDNCIGQRAFYNCESLKEVELEVDIIEDNAFRGCKNLEHVILPAKKLYLGDNIFAHCIKLTELIYLGTVADFKEC